MTRPLRWLLVITFILLAALPGARPVRASEPTTFHGVLSYSENGPGAGTDGLLTALLFVPVSGGLAITKLQSVFNLIMAGSDEEGVDKALKAPSVTNLAGMLPLSGHYSAKLDF